MKIVYIIPQLGCGGAEVLLSNICMELISKGHDVKLISLKQHHQSFSNFPNQKAFLKKVDIHILNDENDFSFQLGDKKTIQKLEKELFQFKPDVIHSHLFEAEIVSRSCYYPDTKWYSHCHDNIRQFSNLSLKNVTNKQKLIQYLEKKFLFKRYRKNGGNHFIAISKHTESFFKKTASPFPVTLLPNAIQFGKFNKNKTHSISKNLITLVNIGSFVDKKNQLFLVEVVHYLKKSGLNVILQLIGDGINRSKIENRIKELDLTEEIKLTGNVDNVEDYLNDSDIYLHSATYEPFGLVILEAMAAGLPVVCLDGGGNNDIIIQGVNGFMINEVDVKLFSKKVIQLIENPSLYQSISTGAINFAKGYDIEDYVVKLLKIYNRK